MCLVWLCSQCWWTFVVLIRLHAACLEQKQAMPLWMNTSPLLWRGMVSKCLKYTSSLWNLAYYYYNISLTFSNTAFVFHSGACLFQWPWGQCTVRSWRSPLPHFLPAARSPQRPKMATRFPPVPLWQTTVTWPRSPRVQLCQRTALQPLVHLAVPCLQPNLSPFLK